jgi:hypothetical protein
VKELIPPLLLRAGPLSIEQIGAELGNPNDRTLRRPRAVQPKDAANLMPIWLYPVLWPSAKLRPNRLR